ncbi:MAG TPA: HEAT repeat domain-containing protein [Bryobacteraceae bacterium]|nr:HEAT repeat domain-containing protein [Bryobacteraceae bacterium]
MKCDQAARLIPLYLYGELGFDEEEGLEQHLDGCESCRVEVASQRRLHDLLDAATIPVDDGMLTAARLESRRRLKQEPRLRATWWSHIGDMFSIRFVPAPVLAQSLGAVALVAVGFLGARIMPGGFFPRSSQGDIADVADPVASRVRYVEPGDSGQVQIVIEETHRRTLTGHADDEPIRRWLMAATKDPADAGVRVQSVELLKSQCGQADIRNVLLYALQHDPNAGVRLKALDGLKQFSSDPETKQALTRVLLADSNPGVRTQVVDLLVQHREDQMVGVLQELLSRESNRYIRQRCERALHEMNASPETY